MDFNEVFLGHTHPVTKNPCPKCGSHSVEMFAVYGDGGLAELSFICTACNSCVKGSMWSGINKRTSTGEDFCE